MAAEKSYPKTRLYHAGFSNPETAETTIKKEPRKIPVLSGFLNSEMGKTSKKKKRKNSGKPLFRLNANYH
ncbi:MAG: hypothetical protein LBE91_08455 [Tannerella sp.]|nr:hypothetical protein [Tannerella sp.]